MAEYPSRPGHVALGTIQVPWMLSGPAILAWYPAQFAYAAGLTGAGRTVAFGRTMTLLSGVACLGAACAARAVVVGVLLAPRTVAGFVVVVVALALGIALIPEIDAVVLGGLPLSWLLQAFAFYPVILVFAVLYVRTAVRNERRYRALRDRE